MHQTFGRELLSRIKKKYTHQTRFAEEMDVKDASLTQWIKSRSYPNKKNLAKICKLLFWDLEEAKNMIEREKKRNVLREHDTEFDQEQILASFCVLPLPEQEQLLKEMTEIFYARKLPNRVVINLGGERTFAV
jgi:transcriptional regulator with XRE-family HTH domain